MADCSRDNALAETNAVRLLRTYDDLFEYSGKSKQVTVDIHYHLDLKGGIGKIRDLST